MDGSALFRVDGLVAVITGGGSGIGLSMAKALDANGAKAVYIIGRRENVLQEAAKQAKNGTIIPVVGDVSKKESLAAIAERVRQDHGYVNAVIANAGTPGPCMDALLTTDPTQGVPAKDFVDFFWDAGEAAFTETMHVNTTAVFFTALAFLDLLMKGNEKGNMKQKSQILVTTSVGAYVRAHFTPAYVLSKAATAHLVKLLSTMWAPYSVRVNALAPGWFVSDMASPALDLMGIKNAEEEGAFPKHLLPAQRCGTEEDIAGTVLYALGRAGSYVNGGTLMLDGGLLGRNLATY